MKSSFFLVVIVVLVASCATPREGLEKNSEFSDFSLSSDHVDFDQVLENYSASSEEEITHDVDLQQREYDKRNGNNDPGNWGRQIEYDHHPENWSRPRE